MILSLAISLVNRITDLMFALQGRLDWTASLGRAQRLWHLWYVLSVTSKLKDIQKQIDRKETIWRRHTFVILCKKLLVLITWPYFLEYCAPKDMGTLHINYNWRISIQLWSKGLKKILKLVEWKYARLTASYQNS